MNIISFKVNLKTAFNDGQLKKSGWQTIENDKLYTREKGKYKYKYIIKTFGKIRVSDMVCILSENEAASKYEDMKEFSLEEGWKSLWNKSFEPESVEIIMKDNILNLLVENKWKPSVLGVIEYISEDYNLSYYYPAPEDQSIYKLVDDNPLDVLNFVNKLKMINIM